MKPTITNAFTVGSTYGSPAPRKSSSMRDTGGSHGANGASGALGLTLAPMQADLRASDFGYSLELSPIQAIDAVHALVRACPSETQFLVSVEQSAWRNGNVEARLDGIVRRLGIPFIDQLNPDQLVLTAESLASLVAIAMPTRLLVIAIDGPVEASDARSIGGAIDAGRSPLTAELRALAALEVLGDRSVVLHARERLIPLHLIAQNFQHYLAAILERPAEAFSPPEVGQVELLMGISGALTVRPVETQVTAGSIDIGVNTSLERFNQPASLALIYDRPSNSWHAE